MQSQVSSLVHDTEAAAHKAVILARSLAVNAAIGAWTLQHRIICALGERLRLDFPSQGSNHRLSAGQL
jgi:hypothetical protein